MMRAALALMLMAVSGVAAAHWIALHESDEYIAYADPATRLRFGDIVQLRDLIDLKTAKASPYGVEHASSTASSEFDCRDERMRTLRLFLHSGRMGEGEIVETAALSDRWLPVAQGSLLRILWQYACGAG
jgi:hypothetical protein